ncbi:peptidase M20 [Domibacillus antri]|uniref:Peptidase M20 n=1 Tax=Domibacillus antri TaxID=1714264 RepID=A0A1Q8Q2L2_9BACI|nr:M20 family metallopeptidase [Domibacillus antri]OLN21558.1 peptidase M20 [Domibacillus antri]
MIQLEELYDEMVQLRRDFHEKPELSFFEKETPAFIAGYLRHLGLEVRTGVGGNGVVAKITGRKQGKTVALRADFDALPIQDEKEVSYKSKVPGVMHACGHDAHTAMLLCVAKVLVDMKEELCGTIVLIHQFAEEQAPGGAKPMIEAGCLDGVDAIFGLHFWSMIPYGKVGWRNGPIMAAADRFNLTINGKGGHGAAPHETVDPIVTGTSFIQQLQHIVSRSIDPLKSAVVTVGQFHAGNSFNVIPDKAEIEGTVRTFDPAVQSFIMARMEKLAENVCESAGGSGHFVYTKGYPAVVNHEAETKIVAASAETVVGAENTFEMTPMMGGEDFAYYLQKIPGSFFFVGAGNEETGAVYPHHHPKFDLDERAMLIGGKILLTTALLYLHGN